MYGISSVPHPEISRMMRTVCRLRPSQCAPGSQCSPQTPTSVPQVSSFPPAVSFRLGLRPKGSDRPVFVWSLKFRNLLGSSSPVQRGQPVDRAVEGAGQTQPEEGSQARAECCDCSREGNILKGPPESWGDSWVCKMHSTETQCPEFEPMKPCENPGRVAVFHSMPTLGRQK